jgi:hypothetical protein
MNVSVSTATTLWVEQQRNNASILGRRNIFSLLYIVQADPGAHTASSYTMGTASGGRE